MGKPSGRRTVPVRVFLSPTELEVWEALRQHLSVMGTPPSRADWIMDHVFQELDTLGEHLSDRCLNALTAFDRENAASHLTWQQLGGRPASIRPAPPPPKEVIPQPERTSPSCP